MEVYKISKAGLGSVFEPLVQGEILMLSQGTLSPGSSHDSVFLIANLVLILVVVLVPINLKHIKLKKPQQLQEILVQTQYCSTTYCLISML